MSETIDITVDGRGVATLTLNRPDRHNAMDAEMIGALTGPPTGWAATRRCGLSF
jgi:methylglutaconyl-CoA hydratase